MFRTTLKFISLFVLPKPAFTFPSSNHIHITRGGAYRDSRLDGINTPILDTSFPSDRPHGSGPKCSTPRDNTSRMTRREPKCCCACHLQDSAGPNMSGYSLDSITNHAPFYFSSSSPSPDRRYHQMEYDGHTRRLGRQTRWSRKPQKVLDLTRSLTRDAADTEALNTSRSLRRTKGTIVLVEGSGLQTNGGRDLKSPSGSVGSPIRCISTVPSPSIAESPKRPRGQSQSRYFELDLSPILEDWVFTGNAPRLGAPTPAADAAAVGLGPAFSIDSRLSGTPSTQADNRNATKTRVSASGVVQSSTKTAFTQSSSMSCSSFGELLEKMNPNMGDTNYLPMSEPIADENISQLSNYQPLCHSVSYDGTAQDGQDEDFEEQASNMPVEDVDLKTAVPALVLTFPTPELSQAPTIPYFPAGEMLCFADSNPTSGLAENLLQQHSLGLNPDLGVMYNRNSGPNYPFVAEVGTEGYSPVHSTMVRARRKVASLFSVGLRRTRIDDVGIGLASNHTGRGADESFYSGRLSRVLVRTELMATRWIKFKRERD